ncbi:unnamed protein product, partial [Didymodactylos carnosus]
KVTSIDLKENDCADVNIILSGNETLEQQAEFVNDNIRKQLNNESVDAILNVAGGWAGGNAEAEDFIQNSALMWKQTMWSSLIVASLASKYLKEDGLLTLPGAAAALEPTPGMIGYGAAKSAVHQMTKSLAAQNSGLPNNASVLAIAPIILDTPMNRKWMPKADMSTWTPLEYVADHYDIATQNKIDMNDGHFQMIDNKSSLTPYRGRDWRYVQPKLLYELGIKQLVTILLQHNNSLAKIEHLLLNEQAIFSTRIGNLILKEFIDQIHTMKSYNNDEFLNYFSSGTIAHTNRIHSDLNVHALHFIPRNSPPISSNFASSIVFNLPDQHEQSLFNSMPPGKNFRTLSLEKSDEQPKKKRTSLNHHHMWTKSTSKDPSIFVTCLNFQYCIFITNNSIKQLISQQLVDTIDLRNCLITVKIFKILSDYFPRLKCLRLGVIDTGCVSSSVSMFVHNECEHYLKKPTLRSFTFEGFEQNHQQHTIIQRIFNKTLEFCSQQLQYLDLSRSTCIQELTSFIYVKSSLSTLILYDISPVLIELYSNIICELKTLSTLDLSRSKISVNSPTDNYKNSTLFLAKLVYSLEQLKSLDISGTNLGGEHTIRSNEDEREYLCEKLNITCDKRNVESSIPGLLLLKAPLEFLGVLDCDQNVAMRPNLPAKKIAGEYSENQLLTAIQRYINRSEMITHVVTHLFRFYKDTSLENFKYGGELLMECMDKHIYNLHIQISGSASLFYIIKAHHQKDESSELEYFYVRQIVTVILNAMTIHSKDNGMMRNGLLSLIHLQLPDDIMFACEKAFKVLLELLKLHINMNISYESFVLRTAMYLLNCMACTADGEEKLAVGNFGAIEVMMNLIQKRIHTEDADEILEVAWAFLWNITDETAENCVRFVTQNSGLQAFQDCLTLFESKEAILRNMMGLMGNLAEVPTLRSHLVKNEILQHLQRLVQKPECSIEIAYNAAGVLAHIFSDGPSSWTADQVDRTTLCDELFEIIQHWDVNLERNINYRSFSPILRLVKQFDEPSAQIWGCWGLANLTSVFATKYCPLLHAEHGDVLLNDIVRHNSVHPKVKHLASLALENVCNYLKTPPSDLAMMDVEQ